MIVRLGYLCMLLEFFSYTAKLLGIFPNVSMKMCMARPIIFIFSEYSVGSGQEDFEMLPIGELAELLRQFYGALRTQKGEKYGRSALVNIRSGINRHLTSPPFNRCINIMRDVQFQAANQVLKGILRRLRLDGEDVTKHKEAISEGDMKKLYETKTLNNESALGLQRKVYLEVSLHFGRRGREGLRNLNKDSFVFKVDDKGREFVTLAFNELDKNHQVLMPKELEKKQIMYSQPGDDMCPVLSLKKYISKLNPKCPCFFQRPREKMSPDDQTWFENKPLGVKSINSLMKSMSVDAGLSVQYTNHCVRATTATVLAKSGIDSRDVISVTGHKHESSLKSYIKAPTMDQRHTMSEILHDYGKENQEMVEATPGFELQPIASTSTMNIDLSAPNNPSMSTASYATGALFAGANFNGPTTINVNINTK